VLSASKHLFITLVAVGLMAGLAVTLLGCYGGGVVSVTVEGIVMEWIGEVGNLEQPLEGAVVTLGGLSATTGADGSFTIADVPPGPMTITVAKTGYQAAGLPAQVTISAATRQLGTIYMVADEYAGPDPPQL